MADIKRSRLLYLKGLLMMIVGLLASFLLLAERPTLRNAALLGVAIWGFCRAYYFAFYVIEHYIDPGFRYAGLTSFVRHAIHRPGRNESDSHLDRRR